MQRMRRDRAAVTLGGEPLAIDRQRGAGGHARRIGRAHHERAEPAHLLFEEADRVIELVAAEGVAADELGEPIGLVDRGRRGPGASRGAMTGTPREAACQAASLPARPPPMMWIIDQVPSADCQSAEA